jgi:valyl-tRNA synthetase
MDKNFDPKTVEDRLYRMWDTGGYFRPEVHPHGTPYSIVLPPPNVTGTLHMGHALMLVIEDILIRYHRMKGDKTLWLPGTDHAAIATNAKVEAILWKEEEKTKDDLGRVEFLKRVEAFALASHDTIVSQMRKMGASVDWKREAYTFDEKRNLAVRTAFKNMYDQGLIYKGARIVNWDPKLKTTVSDDEMEWKDEAVPLYYLKYGPFTIATARPETKFGDKYVVMHPDDKRYQDYTDGQKIDVEWLNGIVTATVIKDEAIDMEFGTGVMTITPWHDRTDFEIAERHHLDREQIIDFRGLLLPIAGEFAGQHIKKARPMIVEKLKEKGLLVKIQENYMHRIATNSRGGGIIEPQIKEQWFVAVNKEFSMGHSDIKGIKEGDTVTLKSLMRHVVESGQVAITPDHFTKIYYHWIDNLRDWCISRQIWFGHQVPVWYKGSETYCGVDAPKEDGWVQDPDTLDTWFSSGLWTFSTLGWPEDTMDLREFHPTNVLETGYDILFFWVARMILMTTCLRGQIPFHNVLLHGLVRDANKQKMSKSKGNIVDPLDLSGTYGTDALRIALIFSTAAGNDIPLSEDKIRGMKFFTNKLWNIARFIELQRAVADTNPGSGDANTADQEMQKKISDLTTSVSTNIDAFRLHDAAQTLYQFVWHEFADIYIEDVKKRMDAKSFSVLSDSFITLLKLLHPFMPFVTEEIWSKMPHKETTPLIVSSWPTGK